MEKHKYLSNFECFSLRYDALFGMLGCDYTQKEWEIMNLCWLSWRWAYSSSCATKNNPIYQLFKNHLKMLNQGKVDPPIISKVIVTNVLAMLLNL
jgi:hypothetical protein